MSDVLAAMIYLKSPSFSILLWLPFFSPLSTQSSYLMCSESILEWRCPKKCSTRWQV